MVPKGGKFTIGKVTEYEVKNPGVENGSQDIGSLAIIKNFSSFSLVSDMIGITPWVSGRGEVRPKGVEEIQSIGLNLA
jgi:hypothetical protein